MNGGLNPQQYGAPLNISRVRYKLGQGSSQVLGEAVVLGTTDVTGPSYTSVGSGAPTYNVVDLVLQMPWSNGRSGTAPVAAGALSLQVPDGTVYGGNRRGYHSVDLQTFRQFPTDVASGAYCFIAGGAWNSASGAYNFVAGAGNSASGTGCAAIGYGSLASGAYSVALGLGCVSDQYGTVALGAYAHTNGVQRSMAYAGSQRAAAGDSNIRWIPQSVTTTNATPTVLTTNTGAAGTTTTWTLPNNRAACFFGYITARNTSTGDMIAWRVEGAFKRLASAATIALVGTPTVTVVASDAAMSACALAVSVNTTDGALRLTATGLAATTIAWHGFLNGPENG